MNSINKVYIDYNLLMTTSKNLETLELETTSTTTTDLEDSVESLMTLGKLHDNCFPTTGSDKVFDTITEIDKGLKELVQKIDLTVGLYSQAETSLSDSFSIESKGLRNVYKEQFKSNKEITAGYDAEYYQKILDSLLNNAKGTRARSTVAAIFLATSFPHLPYFWGGGHDSISIGVDPTWGTPKTVTAGGDETTGTEQPNSLDCSGYISWALKNGGYDIDSPMVTTELEDLGMQQQLKGADPETIKTGDFGYMSGHIGMVVNVEGDKVTIAHCSGSGNGMNLTIMDVTTGKVIEDATNKERIGKEYFDRIISIEYKD